MYYSYVFRCVLLHVLKRPPAWPPPHDNHRTCLPLGISNLPLHCWIESGKVLVGFKSVIVTYGVVQRTVQYIRVGGVSRAKLAPDCCCSPTSTFVRKGRNVSPRSPDSQISHGSLLLLCLFLPCKTNTERSPRSGQFFTDNESLTKRVFLGHWKL